MKICFALKQKNIKIKISTVIFSDTWTCWDPGDDGLGIGDQGWLGDKSFSQETKSTVQRQPSIGSRPVLKSEVQDARTTLAHTPPLFSGCL
ncbi:MAG: hypothetical protein SGJ18_04750 [Pseudomonadota bacterium]|nr:hypothetical protein [Pseudomonadota bacterium]